MNFALSRSHPALGEDSDSDGDIEVPRFQSLDCVEDSDGDLEVERNRNSFPLFYSFLYQVERDIRVVEEIVVHIF